MSQLNQIIEFLSDGNYHSGEDLGNKLNLSRSAIWKYIQQLKLLNLDLESLNGKGYRIPGGLALFNKKIIQKYLSKENLALLSNIEIFDSLPSTNDYLLQKMDRTAKNIACFAETQTEGKGRLGRRWQTPFGRTIPLSLLWVFKKEISELGGLSLAIGLAIIDVLEQIGIHQGIALKWPNDILWNNQKLAGILIELQGEAHHNARTVIGVGLNVNLEYITTVPHCTSLQTILGSNPDRNKIAGLLLNSLINTIIQYQEKGFKSFISRWKKYDCTFDKMVTLLSPLETFHGKGCGINDQGHFLLETKGLIKSFPSGEVSLRF